jgi:hypothetical protein
MDSVRGLLADADPVVRIAGVLLFALVFVLSDPREAPEDRRGPRRFIRRFAGALGLQLVLVAALNLVVNPFGIYPTHVFEPIVLNSRVQKTRMYAALPAPPEVVVLGNSVSFTMAPHYIEQRTGRRAFNASVHGGVPADYLAFFRFMLAIGKVPKLLVVPVSVETLRPNLPTGFEPHDPLRPYRPGHAFDPLEAPSELIGLPQTEASLRLLSVEWKGRGAPQYRFEADGFGQFLGTTPLDAAVDSYLAGDWGPGLFAFETLEEHQLASLHELLTECRAHGVRVVAYIPPYQPRAAAVYALRSRLPDLKGQLVRWLQRWQGEGLLDSVYDFSRLESFGGTAEMFHDVAHPTAEASRRMLDRMLPALSAAS